MATKTFVAWGSTATAMVKEKDALNTRAAYEKNITQTAFVNNQLSYYTEIYWQELINYPDKHKGEKVRISGRIFNIAGDYTIQIYVSGTYEAVYIETEKALEGIYKDNWVTVYGTVQGKKCFKNSYNADICQPYIVVQYIQKV